MSLFYNIGDLTIETPDNFTEEAKHHLSFYNTEPTEKPDIRFIIHTECEEIQMPKATLVTEVNRRKWYSMPDGGYAFVDKIEEFSDKILNLVVMSPDFSKVEVWFCPSALMSLTNDPRPYHVIQEVLRYALLPKNGTIMHASALAYQGQGVLFSAPSGTGKSTHTGLWQQYAPGTEIVNDDMPVIRMQKNRPHLYGAPWSGKNSIHKNLTVPLSAIVFLERATECRLVPMNKADAVWELFESIRKPVIPCLAEKNLDVIGQIVENLPIYRLYCNISEDAVKTDMQVLSC